MPDRIDAATWAPEGSTDWLYLSQADVYQMMASRRMYESSRLARLYPYHTVLRRAEGVLAKNRIIGSDHHLEIATLNVGTSPRAPIGPSQLRRPRFSDRLPMTNLPARPTTGGNEERWPRAAFARRKVEME